MAQSAAHRGLVVVAEDEAAIADIIRRHLERDGYAVHLESSGTAVEDAVVRLSPAALILDIGLPGRDGIEICRRLRAAGNWVPIVFLSARGEEVDRIVGIELGADDYLAKPFSPRELVARLGGLLRRSNRPEPQPDTTLTLGAVRIDTATRRTYLAGQHIDLTATEFDLLAFLAKHPGQVFSRAQLLDHVWGYANDPGSRTVDVHIAQLRAKLGSVAVLRTVRGVGYAAEPGDR
ncbi:response regulator transcription factor [Flexivirga caeni]|uniref:DNA-binding response regulator n=1 Tax=Flexivirga caeni TaxID=2294115 RepID=A0A3M9M1S2_9MICO|nr:response regulator transcription factor [Flexivirga caeni]RNI19529.1 DNA-binding response regulator [Flexivirga caeni]